MTSASVELLVKLAEIPGRGRALLSTRHIKPGEVLLSDSPLLLYPASASSSFCSRCFRSLPSSSSTSSSAPVRCRSHCSSSPAAASFCSARCLASHSPFLCLALSHFPISLPPELLSPALFLLAAYDLSITAPSDFHRLISLHGTTTSDVDAPTLHSLLTSILPSPPAAFSLELTAALLAKDKANAFGLMEPFDGGDRRVRAYGIYPNASFFNHDCLPNACRFDYVDQARENNTDIVVRAIHDIPVGREVCLSYFPVTWRYLERQTRLMEDYGFRCECDRCVVEKDWSDDDDEDGEEKEDEDEEGMEEEDEAMENMDTTGEDGEDGNFPHAYFFVRYVCDRENCGGTLAPLPPTADGSPSNLMECNVCGMLKTEDNNQQDRQKCSNGSMLH
ncbi:histone-lysine N-methyltransferase ASHR2-like [Zingiber officinale]|uniref:histone-lysine N-methyltransferase ASHR2-like n=1 Tax=Zingiber officinale TaxID=94328 RepID=UPI001C4AAFEB|nr:histone-lysine N-methyltransferase ASHR2-like [Zingiber officinale]